jgi:hypothetical protein
MVRARLGHAIVVLLFLWSSAWEPAGGFVLIHQPLPCVCCSFDSAVHAQLRLQLFITVNNIFVSPLLSVRMLPGRLHHLNLHDPPHQDADPPTAL